MCVCGVKACSNLIILHVNIQFSQPYLLKKHYFIYWPCTCSVWYLLYLCWALIDCHAFVLLLEGRKRSHQTAVGILAFNIRAQAISEVSQVCLFLWSHFCTVLSILLCLVKTDKVCWFAQGMGNSWGMMLGETKRQGLQFLMGILLLAFRRMENCVHCFHWQRRPRRKGYSGTSSVKWVKWCLMNRAQ